MKKHWPLFIAAGLMLLMHALFAVPSMERLLQIPSGYLAAFLLGAPAGFNGTVVEMATTPLLTVSAACSGVRLFSILAGLGGGYWCGNNLRRWIVLLPACWLITLLSNSARIVAAWHFRSWTTTLLPDWLQEFAHMGIGTVWSLTMIATLIFWTTRTPRTTKEPQA